MSQFGLIAKRLKLKSELPDRAKIFCINHVYLNGEKFKIYKNAGNQWENDSRLLLYNTHRDKWYDLMNKPFIY